VLSAFTKKRRAYVSGAFPAEPGIFLKEKDTFLPEKSILLMARTDLGEVPAFETVTGVRKGIFFKKIETLNKALRIY
jgi:hypothetical protein